MQSDAHTLTLTKKHAIWHTHHLKTISSKTTVGWVGKKKMGEWNEDEIGMEMKVKMKSEEWKMRMKVWMTVKEK